MSETHYMFLTVMNVFVMTTFGTDLVVAFLTD